MKQSGVSEYLKKLKIIVTKCLITFAKLYAHQYATSQFG